MATTAYTISQIASAEQLLARSTGWTRGRRKTDGLSFVIFPSSNGRDAYYTRGDGNGCSCRGWLYRGRCAHSLAVKRDAQAARKAATQPKRRGYDEIYSENDWAF